VKCKFCNNTITDAQNKAYDGCCDGVCEYRQLQVVEDYHCKNCGVIIDLDEINYLNGFCSGGCAGEYSERNIN
jgi:hypothetical protein